MNNDLTELEEAVKERLVNASTDVPDRDVIRERVLRALEDDAVIVPTPTALFWTRSRRPVVLLAGVAAAIATAFLLLPERNVETVIVSASETPTSQAERAAAPRNEFSEFSQVLALSPPTDGLGEWIVRAETAQVLTLEFVPDGARPGGPGQFLRIVAPASPTTPEEIVDSLTTSLFGTDVVADTASRIGGLNSRALRLETVDGTTGLGFKIAADTYLEVEGADRVFVAHVVATEQETLVFWVEAGPGQIDRFEVVASQLVDVLLGD